MNSAQYFYKKKNETPIILNLLGGWEGGFINSFVTQGTFCIEQFIQCLVGHVCHKEVEGF